jgi:predicted protein tyrosine phosphatase
MQQTDVRTRLLFVCSRNQWRSPTAESLFRRHPHYEARSAGTSNRARVTVNEQHIVWADDVFVMEHQHRQMLLARFARALEHKPLIVLDIPDDYRFMDEELLVLLRASLGGYLDRLEN